jgi:bloom syndrome protein
MGQDEQREVLDLLTQPGDPIKLLLVTPEKLTQSQKFVAVLRGLAEAGRLQRFVIDEAHCVSQWGHDFRDSYLVLREALRLTFPTVPIMALTATATSSIQQDVVQLLGMSTRSTVVVRSEFNRPNLEYRVLKKGGGVDWGTYGRIVLGKNVEKTAIEIVALYRESGSLAASKGFRGPPSGIVYCTSKKECETVTLALKATRSGLKSEFYHASVSNTQRERIQRQWMEGLVVQYDCRFLGIVLVQYDYKFPELVLAQYDCKFLEIVLVQYDCKFLELALVQYDCKFLELVLVQYDCKFLELVLVQ